MRFESRCAGEGVRSPLPRRVYGLPRSLSADIETRREAPKLIGRRLRAPGPDALLEPVDETEKLTAPNLSESRELCKDRP